jgi:hypothetical protein
LIDEHLDRNPKGSFHGWHVHSELPGSVTKSTRLYKMTNLFDRHGEELPSLSNLDPEISAAVQFFWETLSGQAEEQRASARTARGRRAEVLGGGQMDGFAGLVEDLLVSEGVPRSSVVHDY